MIFSLGGFKFEANVLPESFTRILDYAITAQDRINNHAALYANKKHKEEIELTCITLPLQGARNNALDPLFDLAATQQSYILVNGKGVYFGKFVIMNIEEKRSIFLNDGTFLQQNFTLKLIRDFNA